MTTTPAVGDRGLVRVAEPLFTDGERAALAGFLAGYSGLTREAYTLDLRQYISRCAARAAAVHREAGRYREFRAGYGSSRSGPGHDRAPVVWSAPQTNSGSCTSALFHCG